MNKIYLKLAFLLVASLILLVQSSVKAEVYKCLNSAGEVTFSQIKCNINSENIEQKESEGTKIERAKNLRRIDANRLQAKYTKLKNTYAELKATQTYNDGELTYGRSALHSAYGTIIKKVLAEMEKVKMEAKEKNIKLW